MAGTTNVWRLRSCAELSTWIRYTSSGESGSTNVASDSGIRVNGGSGPDSDRGVDASDEALDAIALVLPARRADLAILLLLFLALVRRPLLLDSSLSLWFTVFSARRSRFAVSRRDLRLQ